MTPLGPTAAMLSREARAAALLQHTSKSPVPLLLGGLMTLCLGACAPAPGPLVRPTAELPNDATQADPQASSATSAPDNPGAYPAKSASSSAKTDRDAHGQGDGSSPQSLIVPCATEDSDGPRAAAGSCSPAFQIRLDESAEMLTHDDKVHFLFGKEAVHPESAALVRALAAVIRDNPDLGMIRIEVHSDSRGSTTYNLKLTQDRADALRTMMIEAGAPAARLRAIGRGEERPIISENPQFSRSASRRVELWIRAQNTEPGPRGRPTGAAPLRPIAPKPSDD